MRISREEVAANREHLIQVATDRYREAGFNGIGVADLMQAAGMAPGSFYRYFDSKDNLLAECCARLMADTAHRLTTALAAPVPDSVGLMADSYLSPRHRDNRARGCGLAALGGEIAHESAVVRRAATPHLQSMLDQIAAALPAPAPQRTKAIGLMASLMGGLVLSRIADDSALSAEILDAVRASVRAIASASAASRKTSTTRKKRNP